MEPTLSKKLATSKEISLDRKLLENPYAHLNEHGGYSALQANHSEASKNEITTSRVVLGNQYAHLDEIGDLSGVTRKKQKYSKLEIENKVKSIHRLIWRNRQKIWGDSVSYVEMLDPIKAFDLLGYSCSIEATLGEYRDGGKVIEAAGLIDNDSREVKISQRFTPEVRRFTAAHELGHALLHTQTGLHRDRPLDGTLRAKSPSEYEADFFASRFLMPEKLVRASFKKYFLVEHFVLNEDTASGFRTVTLSQIKAKYKTKEDFSRLLASAEQYNGARFISLASQFRVSIQAMAIRLEELELFTI